MRRTPSREILKEPLTPEAKYFLGLLYADGSLMYYGDRYPVVGLALKASDAYMVRELALAFGLDENRVKVYHRADLIASSGSQSIAMIRFSVSDEDAGILKKFGIVPRKSCKEEFPKGMALDRDFIRGIFDGDGGIHVNKGSHSHIAAICGSFSTCEMFSSLVLYLTKFSPKIFLNGKTYQCSAGCYRARRLLEYLYYPGHIHSLVRKRDKVEFILGEEREGKYRPRNW